MTRPTKPLDIYIRVSDVRGRKGPSFIATDVQEERCRAAAAARGIAIGEVFSDLDQPGSKMSRPEFDKALKRIKDGISGGIIVARIDRFARSLVKGLQTIATIEDEGGVVIAADGDFDTSTSTGRLVLRMMLSLAEFELDRIGDSWKVAQERATRRHVHMGPVAFGYERGPDGVLVPKEGEAELVRQAFEARAGGASIREVVMILGGPPKHHAATASRLLRRRVYIGELKRGDTVIEHAHEPLVDVATFLAAQRETKPKPPVQSSSLLSGLIRCEGCGFKMTQSRDVYTCNNGRARGCTSPATIKRRLADLTAMYTLLTTVEGAEEPVADLHAHEAALSRAEKRLMQAQATDVQDALGHEAWIRLLADRRHEVEAAAADLGAARAAMTIEPARTLLTDRILHAPIAKQRAELMFAFDFFSVARGSDMVAAWLHGVAPDDIPRSGKRNGGVPRPLNPKSKSYKRKHLRTLTIPSPRDLEEWEAGLSQTAESPATG